MDAGTFFCRSGRIGGRELIGSAAKLKSSQHDEAVVATLLLAHAYAVDRKGCGNLRVKFCKRPKQNCARPVIESTGERHVETKLLHHIWIAPCVQVLDLAR